MKPTVEWMRRRMKTGRSFVRTFPSFIPGLMTGGGVFHMGVLNSCKCCCIPTDLLLKLYPGMHACNVIEIYLSTRRVPNSRKRCCIHGTLQAAMAFQNLFIKKKLKAPVPVPYGQQFPPRRAATRCNEGLHSTLVYDPTTIYFCSYINQCIFWLIRCA